MAYRRRTSRRSGYSRRSSRSSGGRRTSYAGGNYGRRYRSGGRRVRSGGGRMGGTLRIVLEQPPATLGRYPMFPGAVPGAANDDGSGGPVPPAGGAPTRSRF